MSETANVFLTPYWTNENPRQDIIIDKLEDHDINVHKDSFHPVQNLYKRFKESNSDIFHLEWLYLFLDDEDPVSRTTEYIDQIHLIKEDCDEFVWTIHNKCNHEKKFPQMDRLARKVTGEIADTVRVWDERTGEIAKSIFDISRNKITLLPQGNYIPAYDKVQPEKYIGLQGYNRVFLYFGMIREYKQVEKLIDTFKQIDGDNCLVVAGKPYNMNLRQQIMKKGQPDEIRLDLRYIPKKRIASYVNECDWTVFPYKDVFNSGSVVLSMSLGKPVIAPDRGVVSNYLPEGNIVYTESLEEALRRGRDTTEESLSTVSQKNKERAKTYMNWEKIVDSTISIYNL